MVLNHSNYRDYLKTVLAERIMENPAYSLRAFARWLGVAPSLLSDVANGNKNFSQSTAARVARKLGLNPSETEYFCLLVQQEKAKNPEARAVVASRLSTLNPHRETQDLSVDTFRAIADWYHIPILAMTELPDFDFQARDVAKRLGISNAEADAAISRLIRLELIERDAGGKYRRVHFNPIFKTQAAHQGLRHFHRQMLERAISSLDGQTSQEKYIGSETFVMDEASLREAGILIEECVTKVAALASA
ncbi:MAG: TIGR02147 family protein, partial [Bacteriovoracia bacterium]